MVKNKLQVNREPRNQRFPVQVGCSALLIGPLWSDVPIATERDDCPNTHIFVVINVMSLCHCPSVKTVL
jgi:hypothetical protein